MNDQDGKESDDTSAGESDSPASSADLPTEFHDPAEASIIEVLGKTMASIPG